MHTGVSSRSNRVLRGGTWNNTANNARSANRNHNTPSNRNNNIGFRLTSTGPREGRRSPVVQPAPSSERTSPTRVACGPLDDEAVFVEAPCCIVEVNSASTRRIDRREKLQAYLAMSSVRAYLIVDQRRQGVEAQIRDANGAWDRLACTAGDSITLACIGYTLSVAHVYESVSVSTANEPEPEMYDA